MGADAATRESAGDRLWAAPDPMLIDAGAQGELLVAKVRIALVTLVLLIPIYNVIATPYLIEAWIGLVATLGSFVFALGIWAVVRRGFYRPWLGFLTSAVDVVLRDRDAGGVPGARHAARRGEQPHHVQRLFLLDRRVEPPLRHPDLHRDRRPGGRAIRRCRGRCRRLVLGPQRPAVRPLHLRDGQLGRPGGAPDPPRHRRRAGHRHRRSVPPAPATSPHSTV